MQSPVHPVPPVRPGYEVLNEATAFLRRFIAFPSDAAADACALWACHTHVTEACNASGRLAVLSDLPGSGKTLLMELTGLLSRSASLEADITGPALVALMAQGARTVLIDECDQFWGRNGGESYRQLRTVVNSGYRSGASVTRRGAGGYRQDPIYGPIAMAGLGSLPGSVLSRCVVIRMQQRRPEQKTERFQPRVHEAIGADLGAALGSWARSVALDIASAWPDMPKGIADRQAEVWEGLLAIADCAGGDWPQRARSACTELVLGNEAEPVLSPGQRILSDLRKVFTGDGTSLPTATIITRLFALPDSPWSVLWTDANAPRELSSLLAAYAVKPVKIRDGQRTCQGYRRGDLARVWPQQIAITAAPEDGTETGEPGSLAPETPPRRNTAGGDTDEDGTGSGTAVPEPASPEQPQGADKARSGVGVARKRAAAPRKRVPAAAATE